MEFGDSALSAVVDTLARAGCVAADDEAAELVTAAADEAELHTWVARRAGGEPLAWILGTVRFAGCRVAVDAGVFVPRPQTESLVARAARRLRPEMRVADLCTGCGAVAVALTHAVRGLRVVGVDIDPTAARCARRNGVPVVVGGVGAALRSGCFDTVTAVAPYVPSAELAFLPSDARDHEPATALDGGADGLSVVRKVVVDAGRLLVPGGWLFIEIGADQDLHLSPFLAEHGFGPAGVWRDEDGDVRGLETRRCHNEGW